MPIYDFFVPSVFMAFELHSFERSCFGFIGSLLLPVVLLIVLAGAMGGNVQNLSEALIDALSSFFVIALELLLRAGRTFVLASIYLISALFRIFLDWKSSRGIKLKTGSEPRDEV